MDDIFALYGSVYEATGLEEVVMDVFGSVADRYEKERPGYPAGLADAITAYHGGVPVSVAEIGAGTGKGTEVLAAVGTHLTCIEPDPRMADLLKTKFPQAQVHVGTFGPFLTRPPELRRRGLDLLGRLVDDFGGTVVLDLQTTLTLARNSVRTSA